MKVLSLAPLCFCCLGNAFGEGWNMFLQKLGAVTWSVVNGQIWKESKHSVRYENHDTFRTHIYQIYYIQMKQLNIFLSATKQSGILIYLFCIANCWIILYRVPLAMNSKYPFGKCVSMPRPNTKSFTAKSASCGHFCGLFVLSTRCKLEIPKGQSSWNYFDCNSIWEHGYNL